MYDNNVTKSHVLGLLGFNVHPCSGIRFLSSMKSVVSVGKFFDLVQKPSGAMAQWVVGCHAIPGSHKMDQSSIYYTRYT